jgi:hypothetical protein
MPFLPPEALADEGSIASRRRARDRARQGRGDARGAQPRAAGRAARQGLEIDGGELEALNAAAIVHLIRGDSIAAVADRHGRLRASRAAPAVAPSTGMPW